MKGHYDTAQICRSGHVVTSYYERYPDHRQAFCELCGSPTLTSCDNCKSAIRGSYVYHGPVVGGAYTLPKYCHSCGHPYPWTIAKLQATAGLIEELEGLDAEDRQVLKESLNDLICEGPKSELASLRVKKVIKKVGRDSYELVKKVVTDVVSETVRKAMFGP